MGSQGPQQRLDAPNEPSLSPSCTPGYRNRVPTQAVARQHPLFPRGLDKHGWSLELVLNERCVWGEAPNPRAFRSQSPGDVGGEAGRIWVMEKPGGELAGVAEASHPGSGQWGRPLHGDSIWKHRWNDSRRPVCTRVYPGPRAHSRIPEPTQSQLISGAT